MKYSILFALRAGIAACFLIAAGLVFADPAPALSPPSLDDPTKYQAETDWTGIDYQLVRLERIEPNRLLALIRIFGTSKTPPEGVLLGTYVPIPPGTKPEDMMKFAAMSRGVSLFPTVMTDDLSQTQYPALRPLQRWGYLAPVILQRLFSGRSELCHLQFAVPPPPPPPPPGQPPPVQTLSFLIPHAKGPIAHVPIPPLTPAGAAGSGAAGAAAP